MDAAGISTINEVNFSHSHDCFIHFTCSAELEYRVSLEQNKVSLVQNLCLLDENPAVSKKERGIRHWTIELFPLSVSEIIPYYLCCMASCMQLALTELHVNRVYRLSSVLILHLFSNHSAVKREQIIFTLETMKRRQESGIGISFIDS